MSLDKSMQTLKFDSRLVEYNLRSGQLTNEELAKHLASLPDLSHNCEKIDIDENGDRQDSESH